MRSTIRKHLLAANGIAPLLVSVGAALASFAAKAETLADGLTEVPATRFEAVYTSDVFSNRGGGLRTGTRYLDNLDAILTIDAERQWGIPGLTLFAYGLHNSGGGFSDKFAGDGFTVSNIDAPVASRLYEAWADVRFGADSQHSIRAGLYDLNSEFDSSDVRGLFINSSFGVGQDLAQTGENGPSIFPVASLGMRVDYAVNSEWHVLGAMLDGVPGNPDDPTETTIRLHSHDGLLLVTEVQRVSEGVFEKISFGVWNYTEKSDRLVAEGAGSTGAENNRGWYVSTDVHPGSEDSPWRSSLRVGKADERVNAYDWFVATALTYDFPMPEGREQSLGLGASWSRTTSALQASAGDGIENYEAAVELTWRVTVSEWVTLQPDVQYSINPGADVSLDNALSIGLRFEVSPPMLHW